VNQYKTRQFFFLRYLFWTDWGRRPYLAKIAMDGDPDTRRMVVETGIRQPNAVTIDYSRDHLYWADSFYDIIQKMDINGGRRIPFLTRELINHPFALTFYRHFIYWSDWHTQGILRLNMNGRQDSIVIKPVTRPMELVVFDRNRQSRK
jgi:sugar lactone lactonase YvrE